MLHFEYYLKSYQIEESLLCLNWKREGLFKRVNIYIMTVLGVLLLFFYIRNPKYIVIGFILVILILSMFFILYIPSFLRKKKALKIASEKGVYKIWLNEKGIFFGDDRNFVDFSENKVIFLESENVYTIKCGYNVFCIPKNMFKDFDKERLIYIMDKNNIHKIKIKTGREENNG